MQIEMTEDLHSILEPRDSRPGRAASYAQERYFVSQNVFIVKVRGQCDFGALERDRIFESVTCVSW